MIEFDDAYNDNLPITDDLLDEILNASTAVWSPVDNTMSCECGDSDNLWSIEYKFLSYSYCSNCDLMYLE